MSDLATADLSLLAAASTELQASKWLIRGRQVSKLVQVGGFRFRRSSVEWKGNLRQAAGDW